MGLHTFSDTTILNILKRLIYNKVSYLYKSLRTTIQILFTSISIGFNYLEYNKFDTLSIIIVKCMSRFKYNRGKSITFAE